MKSRRALLAKSIFCLVFFIVLRTQDMYASHAMGADLTYRCLGNNQYELTFSFYRDCSGINAPPSIDIQYSSSCFPTIQTINLQPDSHSPTLISPVCPTALTTCNGGSYTGIQEWIYTGIVTLPGACADWHFSHSECCRNAAITTLQGSGDQMYVYSLLNNTNGICNNSPTFSNNPVPFACQGQSFTFNHGASDFEGDSIAYQLITPLVSATTTVLYDSGYSATQPVHSSPPVFFNAVTGDIRITPSQQEVSVFAVLVNEYRNGVLIGQIERDIQLTVIPCNNTVPVLTGMNNSPQHTATVCANTPFSFYMSSIDPDIMQTTTITWDAAIPGATLTMFGGHRDSAVFNWTPTDADVSNTPYCFTATVNDDNCPYQGLQIYSFCITVRGVNAIAGPDQSISCGASANLTGGATGGTRNYTYIWNPGNDTIQQLNNVGIGTYILQVYDGRCRDYDTVNVTPGAGIPTAAFSFSNNCSGMPVQFTDHSVATGPAITSWTWDFGDVSTSNQHNPSHQYAGNGTYNVSLIVATASGCSDTITQQVTINTNIPVAQFNAGNVCLGSAMSFTDQSGGGPVTNWSWNFGDPGSGSNTSAAANPSHTFLMAGTYTVTLLVTNAAGCQNQIQKNVTVNPNPSVTVANTQICNGAQATLTAPNGYANYSWNPGGNTQSIQVSPAATAVYTITVTDINGCTGIHPVTVTVNPLPNANAGPGRAICVGANTNLNGSGGASYLWNPGNLAGATVNVSPAITTIYTVTVTSGAGCTASDTVLVSVNLLPVARFNAGNVCLGSAMNFTDQSGGGPVTNWSWNFGDPGSGSNTSSAANPSHTFGTAGTYAVTLLVTNTAGCQNQVQQNVTVNPNPTVTVANTQICNGAQATLTAPNGYSNYSWNPGGNAQSIQVTPAVTAVYTITVTDVNGCTGTHAVTVTVNPLPNADAGTGHTICVGGNTNLNGSGGASYLWTPGNLAGATVNVSPATTTIYTVTVTSGAGCTASDTVVVRVNQLPVVNAGSDLGICKGGSTTLTASNLTGSYLWTPGNYATSSITVSPSVTTTYTVTLSDPIGCTGSDAVTIVVNPLPVAGFTSTAPVCLGNLVAFTDATVLTSGNITDWNWDFGGGHTSTAQNPTYAFTDTGNYNVQLAVMSGAGCRDTVFHLVRTNPLPVANAGTDASICPGFSTTLTGTGGTQFAWSPGGGSTATISVSPATTTLYSLQVTDANGCQSSDQVRVVVNPVPVAQAGPDQNLCLGTSTTLLASGGDTYHWFPGNVNTASYSLTPNATTTYSVEVTNSFGCKDTDQVTVQVNPIPVAAFTTSGSVCQHNTVAFNDQSTVGSGSVASWSWNFGNNNTSAIQHPSIQYDDPGTFIISLIVTSDQGCIDTITHSISIWAIPAPGFSHTDVCDGVPVQFSNSSSISDATPLSYTWHLGDLAVSSALAPNHLYSTYGSYPVTLIVNSNHGCTDSLVQLVNVFALPVASFITTPACVNDDATFTDGSSVPDGTISTWSWSFGDTTTSVIASPTHTYPQVGNYPIHLLVSSDHGCLDSTDGFIRIMPKPLPDFRTQNVCAGFPTPLVNFSDSVSINIVQYLWNFGDGDTSTAVNPIHIYSHSGWYPIGLTAISDSGCSNSLIRPNAINIFPNPIAQFVSNSTSASDIYPMVNFENLTGTNGMYYWNFGDSTTSTEYSPTHMYASVGAYDVQLIAVDYNGCVDTTLLRVEIRPTSTVFIPNSFTPNGDLRNDEFQVYAYNVVRLNAQIFDRWGLKIYEWNNLNGGWDGRVNGSPAQNDVYVYRVVTVDVNNKQDVHVGHVSLVR